MSPIKIIALPEYRAFLLAKAECYARLDLYRSQMTGSSAFNLADAYEGLRIAKEALDEAIEKCLKGEITAASYVLDELDRSDCRVQASINEGYAEACTPEKASLQKLFLQNAALFRRIADAPAQKTP